MMTDYKVLSNGRSCHGGRGKWTPNRRRSVKDALVPCKNGIHYCRDSQVLAWLNDELWEFVDLTPGEAIDAGYKMVTRAGKVTKKYEAWNERTARLFAVDCARAVIRYARYDQRELLHACLDVHVGYAGGYLDAAARDAARAAAVDAAWAAARAAAVDAAWAAARAAARAAAWAAARDAARDAARAAAGAAAGAAARDAAGAAAGAAAWDAARAAAWAAAWDDQYALLCRYLSGEEGPFVEADDD
jgi:hypothetical protein